VPNGSVDGSIHAAELNFIWPADIVRKQLTIEIDRAEVLRRVAPQQEE
jgi:hypothetical protein